MLCGATRTHLAKRCSFRAYRWLQLRVVLDMADALWGTLRRQVYERVVEAFVMAICVDGSRSEYGLQRTIARDAHDADRDRRFDRLDFHCRCRDRLSLVLCRRMHSFVVRGQHERRRKGIPTRGHRCRLRFRLLRD